MNLLISLRSETLKLKRTLSLYLCMIAAAFGPLMSMLESLQMEPNTKLHQPWTNHFLEGREPIAIALLPLYTVLICTLLMQIEYRDKTWKQVLSSPQTLFNIFIAKFISLQSLVFLFLFSYMFFQCITAFITESAQPTLYDGSIDVMRILTMNAQIWVLVLGLSSIQFWLSLRFKNFIAPVGIGVAGWFLSPMMLFEFKTSAIEYYPYAFTILAALPDYQKNLATYQGYSLITMLVFLTIAFIEFRTKKVRS